MLWLKILFGVIFVIFVIISAIPIESYKYSIPEDDKSPS